MSVILPLLGHETDSSLRLTIKPSDHEAEGYVTVDSEIIGEGLVTDELREEVGAAVHGEHRSRTSLVELVSDIVASLK
jgi:hypothetical protein